ncbi:MAG: hypothetical protein HC808_11340 [Candidatus Competibacteraceae bacterium]|nr:hypothetical protein [Candidatus Competibacteraceae bacterium]
MSFRFKTIFGVVSIQIVVLAILVWHSMGILRQVTDEALTRRAATTATLFASITKDAVLSSDLATLQSAVQELLTQPELSYARVLDERGRLLAAAGESAALNRPFKADNQLHDVTDGIFDTFAPVTEAGVTFGRVEVGLATATLQATFLARGRKHWRLSLIEMIFGSHYSLIY